MKKVFVCSPYSGDIEGNTERAKRYCWAQIEAGNVPFAPHLYFPQFMDENDPEQRDHGIRMGLEIMKHCDMVIVYGSKITPGMEREIQAACGLGKEIKYFKIT